MGTMVLWMTLGLANLAAGNLVLAGLCVVFQVGCLVREFGRMQDETDEDE